MATPKLATQEVGTLDDLLDQLATHAVWLAAEERCLTGIHNRVLKHHTWGMNKAHFRMMRLVKKRHDAIDEILATIEKLEVSNETLPRGSKTDQMDMVGSTGSDTGAEDSTPGQPDPLVL